MNPSLIVIGLVLCSCATAIEWQIECSPDGSYGSDCMLYTNCTGGIGRNVDCDWPRQAYDYRVGQCVDCTLAPYPCCERFNCTGRGYKRFAVKPGCTYFHTCYQDKHLGAYPCNNPDNQVLVFDEVRQHCDWPSNVPPPCGTKN